MQYSPKLKKAMVAIKAILKEYDIAGLVVIHTPGHSEYLVRIDPSYSCAKFESDSMVRIRAKLADFNGDKDAWTKKVTDTSNMLSLLSEVTMRTGLSVAELSERMDKIVDAEHFGGGHTSHGTQNN